MMTDDLRSQQHPQSTSSEQRPPTFHDGFFAGIATGFLIPPTIFLYQMLKAKRSQPPDLPPTYRPCCNLRRPPIRTASVGFLFVRRLRKQKAADIAQAKQESVEMDTQSWRKIPSGKIVDCSWNMAFTTKQHALARFAGGLSEGPGATDYRCHKVSEEEEMFGHATGHSISARSRFV